MYLNPKYSCCQVDLDAHLDAENMITETLWWWCCCCVLLFSGLSGWLLNVAMAAVRVFMSRHAEWRASWLLEKWALVMKRETADWLSESFSWRYGCCCRGNQSLFEHQ